MLPVRERDVQRGILDLLHFLGYVAVKFPSVGIYKQSTGTYIPQPRRGVSDIIACSPKTGRYIAIEVKAPGKKATPEQSEFIEQIKACGGTAFVADSVQDVVKLLGKR